MYIEILVVANEVSIFILVKKCVNIFFVGNIESGLENQSFNDKRLGVKVNKIL